jgi:hypothetical protein
MKIWLKSVLVVCIGLFIPLVSANLTVYDVIPLKFPWTGFIGSNYGASLTGPNGFITAWGTDRESGIYCAKIPYDGSLEDWAGVYIQADLSPCSYSGGVPGWCRGPGRGKDLTGAKQLIFYARGELGGENVKFGYGYDQADESGFTDSAFANRMETLTNYWQEYQFNLTGMDLSHINGLFMFSVDKYNNPLGVTFYLDNITYIY